MSLKLKHGIIAAFSLLLLISTLYIPEKSSNLNELKNVNFGYPFQFISQDFSDYDSGFSFFPRYQRFELEFSKINNFSVVNFFTSYFSILISLEVAVYLFETIDFKVRGIADKKEKNDESLN